MQAHMAPTPGLYRGVSPAGGRQPHHRGVATWKVVLLFLLALVLGAGVGFLVRPLIPLPQAAGSVAGKAIVGETELDAPLGTYTIGGRTVEVSVREAIEEASSMEAARNADGTYTVPSVDTVLAIARNSLLLDLASQKGIAATDEDALQYARDLLGTDDLNIVAGNYGMDVERTKTELREAATLRLLRDSVVATPAMAEPAAPAAPGDGQADEPKPEYGTYLLGLMGDEWDGNANAWARTDGPYAQGLRDYTISNEGATFSAAQAGYEIALQQVALNQQQRSAEWTAYVNGVLANVRVELTSLVA